MDFVAEKSVWSSVSPLHPIRPVPALTVQLRGLFFTICILLSEDRLLRYEDRDVHSILSAYGTVFIVIFLLYYYYAYCPRPRSSFPQATR